MKASNTRRKTVLRQRHLAATRELLLDALVAELDAGQTLQLSYLALARRAGVSVPTVYRHFPTHDDLIDALTKRVTVALGIREYPRTREGIVATARALFPIYDRHAALIQAQLAAGLAGTVRKRERHRRVGAFEQVLASAVPQLAPERRRAAAGVLAHLFSAQAWQRLRDEAGLTGEAAGEITAWAVDVLWRALEK
jgi:AcrR family transcriptional regulator